MPPPLCNSLHCPKFVRSEDAKKIRVLCQEVGTPYVPYCTRHTTEHLGVKVVCLESGCNTSPSKRGFCGKHSPLKCLRDDCYTPPASGHQGYCGKHSPRTCLDDNCHTTPRSESEHKGYCYLHSPVELVIPLEWIQDNSAENMQELVEFAEGHLDVGDKVYVGLAGESKGSTIQGEIDNDEKRMLELGLMTEKVAQKFLVLRPLNGVPGHDRGRFGEAWLIRRLLLRRLMNERHGGAGRPPNFNDIGAVFVLVGR
mmetsp:Transcript_23446/g.44125  ORF Transcript_23446/g.44125 Transcript_23446/m.44125 type:complete len:255 (+) Transcript_23446:894-1658(+)